ncbi:hypothetical protein BD769DRAFT_1660731 [Suillus cothurnatus]|nr:hypothetical protein BD769DRAFT_1660731 [Suillus cothurnatus]
MPQFNTLSMTDLEQALREMQLELQELKDINKELTEENKILKANQPKRKKKGQNTLEENMVFDEEIRLCGHKYGACYEMFPPDRQLLLCSNPMFAPPLNEPSRYETLASVELALLSELYSLLPSHIHLLVADNHFADVFEDAMNSSRASEIKKLHSKARIQKLLGISVLQRTPKPFPPILFPNLVKDASLKMIFGNWEVFGKIIHIVLWGETGLTALRAGGPPCNGNKWEITSLTPGLLAWAAVIATFLLSADKEFHYSSKGETTKIQYSYMFSSYKKIIIKNWTTEYMHDIVKALNNEEDFTAAMDRALAGITEGEENTVVQDMMDETVADDECSRDRSRANSPLTEPDDEVVTNIAPRHVRGR